MTEGPDELEKQLSDAQQAQAAEGLGEAVRFIVEVRRRPELVRVFREEAFDLDELVALGEELGFSFDAAALQLAFRNDFQLRMAVQQGNVRRSVEGDC